MAVKTKDITVQERDFTIGGSLNNAKGKNAIYIEDWDGSLDYIQAMEIDGDVLTVNIDETRSMSFENYQGLKYIKNGYGTLYNFIEAGKVKVWDPVYPDSTKKNKTVKGTIYSDSIDASGADLYDKKGVLITDYSKKGFTIDAKTGNDTIVGSNYSDVIKGGDGDDSIYGGKGNDTITGGKGHNKYYYSKGEGKDTINLTKGEELEIVFSDAGNYDLKYGNGTKDLIVSRGADMEGSITLKNFGKKDITQEAILTNQNETQYNLKEQTISTIIYSDSKIKSFTGSWMNDSINADGVTKNITLKGGDGDDSIYGGAGNDKIYGGDGNDTIYGGKGNDTIYGDKGRDVIYGDEGNDVIYGGNDTLSINIINGGKGNDTITGGKGNTIITYNDGDGKDVINITKGENLHINATIYNTANPTFKYSENKKDLIISFGSDEETITLKNFVARKDAKAAVLMQGSTVYELLENNTDNAPIITTQNIDKNFTGTWMKDNINAYGTILYKDKKKTTEKAETDKGLTLDGGAGDDTIFGTNYSDIIKGGDGDDLIKGGKGNDTLTGGKGHNTYYYEAGEGYDVINITKGEELEVSLIDTSNYDLKYGNGNKDLIISRSGDVNGSITLKNFAAKDITQSATLTRQEGNQVDLKEATVNTAGIEKSFTGSWMNDNINAMFATKNITLRGGDGNDAIIGGSGNDKIYGDNGNDSIEGGSGNDTITGGKGENHIMYSKGDGNDVINLTKGEDFYLHFDYVENVSNAEWEFKGNDLRIWAYGKKDSDEFVMIKNAKKMIDNTNTAKIIINNNLQLDLKTFDYNVNSLMSQVTAWSSSTGTSGYSLTASTDPTADMGTLASAFTPENFNMV